MLPWILLAVGLLVGAVGAFLFVRQVRFVRGCERVEGRVGRYTTVTTESSDGTTGQTTMCRIDFTTKGGRAASYDRIVLTKRRKVGSTLPVLYDPDDLERVQVVGSFGQWGPSLLVLGAATAFAGSGVVLLVG